MSLGIGRKIKEAIFTTQKSNSLKCVSLRHGERHTRVLHLGAKGLNPDSPTSLFVSVDVSPGAIAVEISALKCERSRH